MQNPTLFDDLEMPAPAPSPAGSSAGGKKARARHSGAKTKEVLASVAAPEAGPPAPAAPAPSTVKPVASPAVAVDAPTAASPATDPSVPAAAPEKEGATKAPARGARAGRSALDAFVSQVRARKYAGRELELHPRLDQMWITRREGGFYLSVQRGRYEYSFSADAMRELASMVDISASLLERLRNLPQVQDCRLLNLLLWAEGARKEARFRLRVQGSTIVSVRSPRYVSLDLLKLAEGLSRLETAGFKLRRYELLDGGLWLEVTHGRAAIDLSPVADRANSKADFWNPGAVLFNQEDGGSSLTVMPVLFRSWGGAALPVASERKQIRKRRHRDVSVQDLVEGALEDLKATSSAPFAEMASRLGRLHQEFVLDSNEGGYLDALNLPFPSQEIRDATLRRVEAGRPTLYRIVTCALNAGVKIEEPSRRLRLFMALGRLAWSRGEKGKRKSSAPASPRPSE